MAVPAQPEAGVVKAKRYGGTEGKEPHAPGGADDKERWQDMRRKYNDLLAKRAGMLTEAETLLKDGKREDYKSKMAEIGNINDEITEVKAFIDEQDRQFLERKDDPGEEKDKAAERGNTLM